MIDWIDRLQQADVQQFIAEHRHSHLPDLALSSNAPADFPLQAALLQIALRNKAAFKLPEWHQYPQLIYPSKLALEQCSSQLTASYKSALLSGRHLVDLTGGLGVDSYFLSEKFESVDYIELDERLYQAARHNFQVLSARTISCHHERAEAFLDRHQKPTDYFFIDPARRSGAQKTYFLEDTHPRITDLHTQLLQKAEGYLLKASPMLDIKQGINSLGQVMEVHVVSVDNECKELLFHIHRRAPAQPKIIAANYHKGNWERFSFDFQQESEAIAPLAHPKEYIYEPNSAIIKSGAFKSIAQVYQLDKLHAHSHLYTSHQRLSSFPGRAFCLIKAVNADKNAIHQVLHSDKANLATRNFPMSVDVLKKKWRIKDGGDQYLFATTLSEGQKSVLICEKLPQEQNEDQG